MTEAEIKAFVDGWVASFRKLEETLYGGFGVEMPPVAEERIVAEAMKYLRVDQ